MAFRSLALVAALLCVQPARCAEPVVEVHFAPTENLEHLDVAMIENAHHAIDMAAYVRSDWPIIDALRAAERRGVVVRIVIDAGQHHAFDKLPDLADNIRVKPGRVFMHLKSYAIDGAVLRAGAANFSASGLKQQDNDLIVIRDEAAVHAFEREFTRIWDKGRPIFEHDSAMQMMDVGIRRTE